MLTLYVSTSHRKSMHELTYRGSGGVAGEREVLNHRW